MLWLRCNPLLDGSDGQVRVYGEIEGGLGDSPTVSKQVSMAHSWQCQARASKSAIDWSKLVTCRLRRGAPS